MNNENIEPCGGCGETDPDKRCMGCRHPFTRSAAPTAGDAGTIDTPEFQEFIGALVNSEYENYLEFMGKFVAHITKHVADEKTHAYGQGYAQGWQDFEALRDLGAATAPVSGAPADGDELSKLCEIFGIKVSEGSTPMSAIACRLKDLQDALARATLPPSAGAPATAAEYKAWLELMREFSGDDRRHVAKLLAHKWHVTGLILQSETGTERVGSAAGSPVSAAEQAEDEAIHDLFDRSEYPSAAVQELPALPAPDVISYTYIGENDAYSPARMHEYGRTVLAMRQPQGDVSECIAACEGVLAQSANYRFTGTTAIGINACITALRALAAKQAGKAGA
ncbi:hypothetical protein E7V67_011340 [[Empedobacter] haloabium]|uniref:Phage protein n=1 Tax=[Empedobacter] haloabium TaxID=592317 RepID=A0ABZ1UU57_9BURK